MSTLVVIHCVKSFVQPVQLLTQSKRHTSCCLLCPRLVISVRTFRCDNCPSGLLIYVMAHTIRLKYPFFLCFIVLIYFIETVPIPINICSDITTIPIDPTNSSFWLLCFIKIKNIGSIFFPIHLRDYILFFFNIIDLELIHYKRHSLLKSSSLKSSRIFVMKIIWLENE